MKSTPTLVPSNDVRCVGLQDSTGRLIASMAMLPDAVHLKSEWTRPSDSYGWSAVLRNTLPLFVLLRAAPVLADVHAGLPWLLSPLLGLLVYRITVVMHDCTHHTLFVSRTMNARVGFAAGRVRVASTSMDSASSTGDIIASYGRAGDPQGFHYVGLGKMSSRGFCWHLVKPLFGLNLRNTFGGEPPGAGNLARPVRTGEFVDRGVRATVVARDRYRIR